jgi:hypothetical protein
LNTGETIALMHSQKMYVKSAGQPMNQPRPAGTTSRAPVPRATGKSQKVGDIDTELYEWSNARGIAGTAWVAKNFPDYARIRADLAVLDKSIGADNDTTPELGALPGMVIRSQVAGGGQTITLALISAKETPLDASHFGIPRDYKEMPKVRPLKQVAPPASPQKPAGGSKVVGNPKTSVTPQTPASPKTPAPKPADPSRTPPANFNSQKPPAW